MGHDSNAHRTDDGGRTTHSSELMLRDSTPFTASFDGNGNPIADVITSHGHGHISFSRTTRAPLHVSGVRARRRVCLPACVCAGRRQFYRLLKAAAAAMAAESAQSVVGLALAHSDGRAGAGGQAVRRDQFSERTRPL